MDLTNVKEVKAISGERQDIANRLLATKSWILIEVKTVEWQRQNQDGHMCKGYDVVFVLGRIQ